MFIAQKLRKENIVEYLLYMWQIEDLIRAYHLNIDEINQFIITPYPISNDEKRALYEWYESLIDMMLREDAKKEGHLQINKNIILHLDELHHLLLKHGVDPSYNAQFYQILPLINQLRTQQNRDDIGDIEICLNFQYGIMLLKMRKAEISSHTLQAQVNIAKHLVSLAKNYNKYQEGELKFDED